MPPDLRDVRVMIPRVRRALEGPQASASGASVLTDDQYEDLIADAVADIILYSGGLFGHTLDVLARDDTYGSPIQWQTSEQLTEPEVTVVVTQAALNYWFFQSGGASSRTSERIVNAGQEWEYTKSAQLLRDHFAQLRQARDDALKGLLEQNPALDSYVNLLAARDAVVDRAIEPYAAETLMIGQGGQESARGGWLTG